MNACTECGKEMIERILPEHTEDLGGIVVTLVDAVRAFTCAHCNAVETEIPDTLGLARTVAIARALLPYQLTGDDLRFMRKALDMNQKTFAEAMGMTAETINRWERCRGAGEMSEKLVRHNVCALLRRYVPMVDYDPAEITEMKIRQLPEGVTLPPIKLTRVVMKRDHQRENAWDTLQMGAA